MGSWQTDREWVASNMVRGPVAVGIFAGRFFSEGFRLYQGNGMDEEFVPRPGPWALYNVQGSINWKITPNLTFEISQLLSDRRNGNATYVQRPEWERRDTRDVAIFDYGFGMRLSPVWDGPTELWDAVTIGRLLYSGDRLGTFEAIYSYRRADQRITGISWFGLSDQRWIDQGLSLKYYRTDRFSVVTNELTLGSDLWDGKFGRESRQIVQTFGTNAVEHQAEQIRLQGILELLRDEPDEVLGPTVRGPRLSSRKLRSPGSLCQRCGASCHECQENRPQEERFSMERRARLRQRTRFQPVLQAFEDVSIPGVLRHGKSRGFRIAALIRRFGFSIPKKGLWRKWGYDTGSTAISMQAQLTMSWTWTMKSSTEWMTPETKET